MVQNPGLNCSRMASSRRLSHGSKGGSRPLAEFIAVPNAINGPQWRSTGTHALPAPGLPTNHSGPISGLNGRTWIRQLASSRARFLLAPGSR
jgi:hypothetical protein